MKLHVPFAFLAIATLALAGCDTEDPAPPEPTTPTPRNVDPIDGGGTSGGTVDGVMTVFVLGDDNKPIEGAVVILQSGTESMTATSDAKGRLDFHGETLKAPVNVHVFAKNFTYTSVFGLSASVLSLGLDTGDKETELIPTVATVTGTVTGWGLLPANTMTRAQVAIVSAVGENLTRVTQDPRPGTITVGDPDGTESNVVLHGTGNFSNWTDYRLNYDNRATSLIAMGGTFTIGATPPVVLTHIGIQSLAGTSSGAAQNIELTHPIDQDIEAVVTNAPSLDETLVVFAVELDDGGSIPLAAPEPVMGRATAKAPALSDALSKGQYVVGVLVRDTAAMGEEPTRSAFARLRGTQTSFTFEKIINPPGAPSAAGRTVASEPSAGATMIAYELFKADKKVWEANMVGDTIRSIELPAVPEGMSDPLAGELDIEIDAIDFGSAVDLNNASFDSLQDATVSSATRRGKVSF